MLYGHGPEAAPTAPLARESLDRATICFGIRAAWCLRLLLTVRIVVAMLGMVCDNPTRSHSRLG